MLKLTVTLVAAAVVFAGCGGSREPTEVTAGPASTVALGDSRRATLELKGEPDWLTALDGFVWVKRADGFVTKIDTTSNEPVAEVRVDTKSDQFCEGIGSGGGFVWSCSGSDVVRIDPKTLDVVDSIPVGKAFSQGRLVFAAGRIWVLSGANSDELVGIDASTGTPGPPLSLRASCTELGAGVDRIWATCPNANMVLGIDPVAPSVEEEVEVTSPAAAVGSETDVWIGGADGLVRYDRDGLEPKVVFPSLSPTDEGAIALEGETVWVRQPSGFLYRIDAATNTVEEQVVPDEPLSGGDVLPTADGLWASAYENNLVLRLRS